MHTIQEEEREMDDELMLIKQIQETEGAIASTLSRCEKMVDNELMDLMSRMTKRPTEGMPMSVVSRVVEKLLALLHHEPAVLVGVEEEVEGIERELRGAGYGGGHEFAVELVDVAYDVEDAIDNLIFKSAAQQSRRGNLEDVIARDDDPLHKKLELIRGKCSALPAPGPTEFCPLDPPQDIEEITEGGTVLLAQKPLHPKMKKKARRIQDKFRLMNDFLKDFDSGELGNRGMVWMMKELLTISSSAVDVMEELISRREQLRRSLKERIVFDMDNLKSQHKLAMGMDQICSKILDISTRKKEVGGHSQRTLSPYAFPNLPQPWCVHLPVDEEEKIEIKKMSVTGVVMEWGDVGAMTKSVASRAMEKLSALLVQEPVSLIGVEEQVQWIQRELRGIVIRHRFTEEAIDVAYDVEEFIDYLILTSASQARSGRSLEDVISSDDDQLHKKLEWIMSKIRALPPPAIQYSMSARAPITEIDWLRLSSALDQNMANTIVSPVIEKVTALLAQGALPPRVKKSASRVQDKFRLMNGFLKDLESVELNDRGMAWMEELCHVSLSTVDVIDQFMKSRQQVKGSWVGSLGRDVLDFGHLISQHKLAKKLDHIYAMILGLSIRRPEEAHGNSTQRTVPRNTSPIPDPTQEPDIISFGDDVHAIMTRLLSDDTSFSTISIVGMPGIGKTTLAKLIYNNEAVVDHFPFRAWTSATDWDELFKDLMGQHIDYKAPRSWKTEERMRQKLNAFLKGKRYLIVLEDASRVNFLNELVRTLPDASNGSKMILTTRSMRLPSKLQRASVHHAVQLRGDNESWALFTHSLKVNISQELVKLRREIVRRCGGLPVAIVKLADVLSQKDATIEEWSSALQQLNQEQQQLWSYTLSRINEDLPLYMQRCLFYFSLFPQDFEIPARRLTVLWVAEGLVQAEDENETPEDVADRYLITLIGKGMVRVTKNKLNGNVKSCLLPDALRRYWSSKALQATFLQVGTNTKSESSLGTGMIRRLTDHLDKGDVSFDHIHGDRKTISASVQPLYREVVSFLSFDTQEGSKPGEDIGNFLHRCISSSCLLLLRVLDLENVFKPKFPEALGKLTRLRYLGLRSTFLDVLPSFVNKLQSLQALDVKHTNITTLPSPIWNMQQLRQLYLNERCHSKVMPQPSVGSSSTLRVLVGLFVDEETPVTDGLDQFINLRKLGLTCHLPSSQQEAVVEWVQKLNNLESLRLKSIDEENQFWDLDLKPLAHHVNLSCLYLLGRLKNPSVGSEFPHSLIELTLSGSELEEDPMQTLDKLPNLKVLRFLANSYLGKNMGCSSGGFPQLQVLKLWKLEQLEEWNVDEGALQALWDLDIRSCKRLKMLPEALRHRARLKLKLTDMCSQFASWKEDH